MEVEGKGGRGNGGGGEGGGRVGRRVGGAMESILGAGETIHTYACDTDRQAPRHIASTRETNASVNRKHSSQHQLTGRHLVSPS